MSASPQAPPTKRTIGARAVRGTLWTVLRYAIEYVLRLGSNLVLTRLLFPEAFGLMALVNAFMAGLAMFSDMGISQNVVQNPRGDVPVFLRTAWSFQVLRGFVLWCMAAALAGVMAGVYEQEQLRALIPIAGLTVLISGFNSISMARMKRHIRLGKIVAIEIGGRVLAVGVMVVWSLISPSVWALVAGGLTSSIAKMVLSHTILGGTVLRFSWDRESVHQLFHFGKWIFISTMLAFLAGQADRLIFGRLLPVATLGVYSIAVMFAAIPTQLVWTIGNLVLFPTFSRSAHSTELLETTYRRVQRPVYVLGAFPVACLAAAGPPFIDALYDARYSDAGWMMQPLAFATGVQVLQTVSSAAILAMGDSRRQALGNGLKFAAMVALVPAGFVLFGVWGGIWGLAVSELFRYAVLASGVRNHGLPGPQTDLAYSLLVAASVTAGLVTRALAADGAWLQLFASVGGVFAVWAPSAAWTLRRELAQALANYRARRGTASP